MRSVSLKMPRFCHQLPFYSDSFFRVRRCEAKLLHCLHSVDIGFENALIPEIGCGGRPGLVVSIVAGW
jgi:hypothetical protein